MKTIFTILIVLLYFNTYSQITFQKTYGGSGFESNCFVTTTSDGGYALAGTTGSFGAGNFDVYVVRTDSEGNVLWAKTFGGPLSDMAKDIKQTSDSGFIITGSSESFGGSRGFPNLYLIRTDKNGDTLWTRAYGGSGGETGWSVQQTADSGFVVTGNWDNTSYLYTVRTKANGDTLWTTINDAGYGAGVVANDDKGFTMCGTGYVDLLGNQMFLCRTDSMGNVVWYNTYGGTNSQGGYGLAKANDGGFITIGFTASFVLPVTNGVYIVKTDTAGNVQWSNVYEGLAPIQGYSIASTGNGYVLWGNQLFNGGNDSTGLLIKIDNSGNLLWARNYNRLLVGNVKQAADGGFVLSGFGVEPQSGTSDFYLIKTDSLGRSGCNDSAATITVDTAATLTNTRVPVPMTGTVVSTTATVIGSGGTSYTNCIFTGIENEMAGTPSSIAIFPNPATNDVVLKTATITSDMTWSLRNILGQTLMASTITSTITHINTSSFANGIYFVEVREGANTVMKKLVINR